ncbi:hypothetical protein BGZ97_008517 [Linnemannia gamsii]|uniref:Uncharacterized protein n=1 Tax=Linnemannia gamsii TaxID=64522 RepID=A0A9P6RB82_9FUNG|nr:hypothetical protein BGZ97_008517 [Linnemannia gamsii]
MSISRANSQSESWKKIVKVFIKRWTVSSRNGTDPSIGRRRRPWTQLCHQEEQEEQEEHREQEQLNRTEMEDLRSNLAHIFHEECDWKVRGKCLACLFKLYQTDCIDALESGELRKIEITDVMTLIGVFAPHIPTPRMLSVFNRVLDDLVPLVRLPTPDIDDSAVMAAVRHYINGDLDDASDALLPLPRKLRIMIESLWRSYLW